MIPPQAPPTPPRAGKSLAAIWGIGCLVAVMFLGIGWVLVWSVACGAAAAYRLHWALGLLAGLAGFAFFFGPAMMDKTVLERQIANTAAMQIQGAPIDLTGKTVVFLGSETAWNDSEATCGYLCDAIVRHGGANRVLFGKNRSASPHREEGPIDLTAYRYFEYETPIQGRSPITSRMLPAQLDQVDYVVAVGLAEPETVAAELAKGAGSYGFYSGKVRIDFQVIKESDTTAVDLYADPIFSALRLVRYGVTAPYFPGLKGGTLHSQHWTTFPKDHGWIKNNGYIALDFLCGPSTRVGQAECVTALDQNPHYPDA